MQSPRRRHHAISTGRAAANRGKKHRRQNDFAMEQLARRDAFLKAHPGWNAMMRYWLIRYFVEFCKANEDHPQIDDKAYEYVFGSGGSLSAKQKLQHDYRNEKKKDRSLHIPELEPSETE